MARALNDILTELNTTYQPQKDQYNAAINQVDPSQQAEEQGLQAAKTDAFSQIAQDANRHGMFYAGMPIAEEQKYTGQQFLPSLANLRAKYTQQKFDLTNALNKVTQDEYTQADSIHQTELDREEKQREFDANLAAQVAAQKAAASSFAMPSLGAGLGGNVLGAETQSQAHFNQRGDKGFNFTDNNGSPVSAATYSQITGIPFRSLLQQMANAGDVGAKNALNFVGNDYGYNPNALSGNGGLYNNLIWGAINPLTGQPLSQANTAPVAAKPLLQQAIGKPGGGVVANPILRR